MLFKKGTQLYAFEVVREAGQNVVYINYLGAPYVPDLADSAEVMSRTVDVLIQSPNLSRIVSAALRTRCFLEATSPLNKSPWYDE